MDTISRQQLKAARTLLDISQADLAEEAGVALITLRRLEGRAGAADLVAAETRARVIAVLKARGIRFLSEGGLSPGPGVGIQAPDTASPPSDV